MRTLLAAAEPDPPRDVVWTRATSCESNACVEVAFTGDRVQVRESRHGRYGQRLNFTTAEWAAFVGGVKAGEFDPEQ